MKGKISSIFSALALALALALAPLSAVLADDSDDLDVDSFDVMDDSDSEDGSIGFAPRNIDEAHRHREARCRIAEQDGGVRDRRDQGRCHEQLARIESVRQAQDGTDQRAQHEP